MGSFTKKYIREFHPEEYLHLSWDIGYQNVTIYDGERIVKQFDQPGPFTKGVTIHDTHLGKIHLEFTHTKPLQLVLRVNGKKYKPTKKGKQEVDLSGVVALFWVLMALNGIALIFNTAIALTSDYYFFTLENHGFLLLSMILYFTSAFLLSRSKYWAFFVGFSYFMLITVLYGFSASQFGVDVFDGVRIIIRLLMLIYLVVNIRKVNFVINNLGERKNNSIIDDPV